MSKENKTGVLYLIPSPIADGELNGISPEITRQTGLIKYYFSENARTARRFLRSLHKDLVLETIEFSEIDKHTGPDKKLLESWLKKGFDVGVISEAGCPCIADPGAEIVEVAHRVGAKVVPLTGPDAIILALMGSGLSGQNFAFNGYLPVKEPMRSKTIKELEARSLKEKQTQLFIETPYRNVNIFNDFLANCNGTTRLCIAYHITAKNGWIQTKTISEWKIGMPKLEKEPAIFLIQA